MPIVNEGLEREMVHVTKPFEEKHIRGLFEDTDPLMQELAYALIVGDNKGVDRMTKEALEKGFSDGMDQWIALAVPPDLDSKDPELLGRLAEAERTAVRTVRKREIDSPLLELFDERIRSVKEEE